MGFFDRALFKRIREEALRRMPRYEITVVDNTHSPDPLALRVQTPNNVFDFFIFRDQWLVTVISGSIVGPTEFTIGTRDTSLPPSVAASIETAVEALETSALSFSDLVSRLADILDVVGVQVVEKEAILRGTKLDAIRLHATGLTSVTMFVSDGRWIRTRDETGDDSDRDAGPFTFDVGDALLVVTEQLLRRTRVQAYSGPLVDALIDLLGQIVATASESFHRDRALRILVENQR